MKKIFSIVLMTAIFMTYFSTIPAFAQDSYVMKVVADGITTYYDDFGEGWVFAVETAEETPTTLTLYRDWYAGDTNSNGVIDSDETPGYFKYYNEDGEEFGTEDGALSTGDWNAFFGVIRFINLTLDLNGHTISRNLESHVEDGNVFCIEAGNIYIKDSSEAQTGKITGGNTTSSGGAFLVNDLGRVFIENCEISGNYAQEMGGGIYIYSSNNTAVSLNNVKITGNKAGFAGGGFGINQLSQQWFYFDNIYLGGDTVIWGNERFDGTQDNLYFPYDYQDDSELRIKHCMGQSNGVPYSPLTKNACIGVSGAQDNLGMTCEGSCFDLESYKYFIPDDPKNYYIRSYYEGSDKTNLYQLYYTMKGNSDVTTPHIKTVSVKDENLIKRASIDYENQVITLTAYNNKKNHFNYVSLSSLITYDVDVVVGRDDICNLLSPRKYRVMGTDQTYIVCTVQVVPYGGTWAENQEEVENNYVVTIDDGERFCAFSDFETGWTEAIPLSQKRPTTVTLLSDWIAPDKDGDGNGDFYYENSSDSEYGTDEGRLHLATDTIDMTIDLNGHTINRNLSSSKEHGQVFRIEDGSLTIKDSSEAQTGKITGGNNTGNGGAFYVDYGKLYINGGEISGNKATNGAGIYATNEDDTFIYINGGKLVGNSATENGGAIYVYNGYLDITGGEISGNTAKNGAGVYWESDNAAYLTGGRIINNNATEKGGVYVENNGEVYVGGDIYINENGNGNLYLDGACIYNACGQEEGVPNKPLTNEAKIGITADDNDDTISGDNSRFNEGDFRVIYSDNSNYFIRSIYKANDKNHAHKLYINPWAHDDTRIPRVKTVSVKDLNLLKDAVLDYASQTITLKAYSSGKSLFESIALDSLIECTYTDEWTKTGDGYYLYEANSKRDLTKNQEYKIMSDNGTYVMCTVKVEWFCNQHKDSDGDCICDYCGEYTLTEFAITGYNAETKEATVFVPEAGKYILIFADYDGNKLENVDIVEHKFTEGINTVQQESKTFMLANGDKVMLWYDLINLVPVCDALTIK